jgi:hypothetical protein
MRPTPGSNPEFIPARRRRQRRAAGSPLLAALFLGALGLMAIGLTGAGPVTAANPTSANLVAAAKATKTPKPTKTPKATVAEPTIAAEPTTSPFVTGRHVYDYGQVLSAKSVTTAESLATKIEGEGGGRVVIYTVASLSDLPNDSTLMADWHIDGLLVTNSDVGVQLTLGTTLKAKLSSEQSQYLTSSSFFNESMAESSMLDTLGWTDAFLSGTHVIDSAGVLDTSGRTQAENAAKDLSGKVGGTVYIDIFTSGADPESAASSDAAQIWTSLSKSMAICFGVKGTLYGGAVDADPEIGIETYKTSDPWATNGELSNRTAANGDVQAAILTAIGAVHSSSLNEDILGAALPWIIFAIVIVVLSLVGGPLLMRKMTGITGPIKNGLPSDAVIESIADTGVTTSGMGAGPEAPEYKFTLQVTPVGGGAPYQVDTKALVPRLFIPMVVPGATVGVLIDPTNPQKVSIDFSRMGGGAAAGASSGFPAGGFPAGGFGAPAAGGVNLTAAGPGGFNMAFDASGQPSATDLATLAGGVQSGAVKEIKGSAAQLLATGTHGTAVITTAQPMGKTVRDINPTADPSRLNDPMWIFTVTVSLAGEAPFPAVFGHRVPIDKVASVAPGVKLAVAVNPENKNQEVAIDWDKSPITG